MIKNLALLLSLIVSTFGRSGTLYIGDSISTAAGNFGKLMHTHLKNKDPDSYVYAVSGAKIDHWSSEQPNGLHFGGTRRQPSQLTAWADKSEYSRWNLPYLFKNDLKKGSIDRMVIQLGTNNSNNDDLGAKYKKLIDQAAQYGVKEFFFILPPVNKNQNFSMANQQSIQSLKDYRKNEGLKVFAYDSWPQTAEYNSNHGGLKSDGDHFWNSELEKYWYSNVSKWLDQVMPPLGNSPRTNASSHK